MFILDYNEDIGYFIKNPQFYTGFQPIHLFIIQKYNLKVGDRVTQEISNESYNLAD